MRDSAFQRFSLGPAGKSPGPPLIHSPLCLILGLLMLLSLRLCHDTWTHPPVWLRGSPHANYKRIINKIIYLCHTTHLFLSLALTVSITLDFCTVFNVLSNVDFKSKTSGQNFKLLVYFKAQWNYCSKPLQ